MCGAIYLDWKRMWKNGRTNQALASGGCLDVFFLSKESFLGPIYIVFGSIYNIGDSQEFG